MHNQQPNGLGVTQFNGMKLKQTIMIGGTEWRLRRDATDASSSFPHTRVNWTNTGCEPLGMNTNVFYCWVKGVIVPAAGTLERPVEVMYIGFHTTKIQVMPNTISQADLDRMHVYIADGINFSSDFANKFLGIGEPVEAERTTIEPWPPTIDISAIAPKEEPKVDGEA